MITKQEIMDLSREFSLSANVVEKDYVLGWILAGIANNSQLSNQWVFKGGTCLKKCYFETFRFSEDLDFTLTNENHINENFLVENFRNIAEWIYDAAGIEIPADAIRFDVYTNKNNKISAEGRIYYIGPLARRRDPARIKLDLTSDEILVQSPVLREVHHPYTDKPENGMNVFCYSFTEIFAEKIRALGERARPRDLYDVIHLYRHTQSEIKSTSVLNVLKKKCDFKSIPIPDLKYIENHSKCNELEAGWGDMLGHQLPSLPSLEQFLEELPQLFEWLQGNPNISSLENIKEKNTKEEIDYSWRPSGMIQSWRTPIPLELIRYAGANHLCIELTYQNSTRLIEPYDLKRTKDGNLLLIAVKHKSGEIRSYRIDRIQGVKVSQSSFIPRYIISLTPFV